MRINIREQHFLENKFFHWAGSPSYVLQSSPIPEKTIIHLDLDQDCALSRGRCVCTSDSKGYCSPAQEHRPQNNPRSFGLLSTLHTN